MANRTFIDKNYSLVKRLVRLYADITVSEAVTPVPTLNTWNYGTFNAGPTIRTYTAAPTTPVPPVSTGDFPGQYQIGAEGIMTVTRTAIGKYTFRLQDNYMRLMELQAYPSGAAGTPVFAMASENTTISSYATPGGGSNIGVAFWDFAAAAVDPIGHVRLTFVLADASEP